MSLKRKRSIYDDEKSFYVAPSIESTLLIETGGLQDPYPLGTQNDLDLSAAASSGARKFQYNRFFWPNELFTFNYQNGSIALAVAYRQASTKTYSFVIYPITLPRIAMTLISSLQENPSSTPEKRKNLLLQLVYYLNLGFSAYGVGNASRYSKDFTTNGSVNYGPPIVLTKTVKGIMRDSAGGTLTVNNPIMPIFSDTSDPPPLIWRLTGNQQLCLCTNDDYWSSHQNDSIGYNILALRDFMGISQYISYNNAYTAIKNTGNYSFYIPSALGRNAGWCCKGAFATGMTQQYTNDFSYSDGYTDDQALQLFNQTVFPNYPSTATITYQDFELLCANNNLVTRQTGLVVGKFIASLIPSRFLAISSNAATRNQKRPFASNNPTISSATMNLFFITSDSINCYQDDTISSANATPSSSNFLKNGVDDSSILTMDPMQSMQNIDLTIQDEWGTSLQNYGQISQGNGSTVLPDGKTQSQSVYLYEEGGASPINFMGIPAWILPYVPIVGTTESLLINENWYCSYNTLYYYNPNYAPQPTFLPSTFYPSAPQSSTIVHFSRVLGYD